MTFLYCPLPQAPSNTIPSTGTNSNSRNDGSAFHPNRRFHSEKPKSLQGAERQFLKVETAIRDGDWPYDNGDDPSFYVARRGGRLTWGVCRQELRTSIWEGSIVVFFSFTPLATGEVLYRLCGVATVDYKTDHCAARRDGRLAAFRERYINLLIARSSDGWDYAETDRKRSQRHKDWLWRMADHMGLSKKAFEKEYDKAYSSENFPDDLLARGRLKLAGNYVVFSADPSCTFISPDPHEVAVAINGQHEKWSDKRLQALTVGRAAAKRADKRSYLRVINSSGRNVHKQIRFEMAAEEAIEWRADLIQALSQSAGTKRCKTEEARASGNARC